MTTAIPGKADCIYTNCYCEENVWKLCERVKECNSDELPYLFAVFVSNCQRKIPIWHQKAGNETAEYLCVWDYHVILVYSREGRGSHVYDLDTRLSFPCSFKSYFDLALRSDSALRSDYHRKYRVVLASDYLNKFASDRSHMKDGDSKWIKPPPVYDCIRTDVCHHNLNEFISMTDEFNVGEVLTTEEFYSRFCETEIV